MANDWTQFRFVDLFAGIGGMRIPFDELGGRCVFSSEWDKAAQDTYEANFGERPHGDINATPVEEIPDFNLLLAGFPCQPFSIMGEKKGFADTRGTLFFTLERILRGKRPAAFLLENVKHLRTHQGGETFRVILERLEGLGYECHAAVLNALDFGMAQKRERTFIAGFAEEVPFAFPAGCGEPGDLASLLESDDDVPGSLFASEHIRQRRQERLKAPPPMPSIWHENKSGNISPLPYSCALRAGASHNYLLVNGVRRLSSRELLRLQGFPEDFKIVVAYSQIRRQTGNSVSVPVIRAIAQNMLAALRKEATVGG